MRHVALQWGMGIVVRIRCAMCSSDIGCAVPWAADMGHAMHGADMVCCLQVKKEVAMLREELRLQSGIEGAASQVEGLGLQDWGST
eukprot:957541-Rhodomonas_salina.1